MQGFASATDAGVEDHRASDFVESIEGLGRFAAALVIKDALKVRDDGEGVIQLEDALLDVAGDESGLGAAKVTQDGVVKGDDQADGRGASCGELLIGGGWRIVGHFMRSLVAG